MQAIYKDIEPLASLTQLTALSLAGLHIDNRGLRVIGYAQALGICCTETLLTCTVMLASTAGCPRMLRVSLSWLSGAGLAGHPCPTTSRKPTMPARSVRQGEALQPVRANAGQEAST